MLSQVQQRHLQTSVSVHADCLWWTILCTTGSDNTYGQLGDPNITERSTFDCLSGTFQKEGDSDDNEFIHPTTVGDITLYPNPNTGIFTIETHQKDRVMIRIFDIMGRNLFEQMLNKYDSTGKCQVDVSSMPNGIYYLQAINDSRNVTMLPFTIIK